MYWVMLANSVLQELLSACKRRSKAKFKLTQIYCELIRHSQHRTRLRLTQIYHELVHSTETVWEMTEEIIIIGSFP
jgi:uncharacterized tellurite resistance protein B-like protein